MACAELEMAHQLVADTSDLDFQEPSRPLALWLITGRCISQAKAILCLLDGGFANDIAPLARALHESILLLSALTHGEDKLVEEWWEDKAWLNQKKLLAARDEWEQDQRTKMLRHGLKPIGPTKSGLKQAYGRISEVAHHRRRHVEIMMSRNSREMPLGQHPCVRVRAAAIGQVGPLMCELVTVAGNALAHLLGREWFVDRFEPLFQQLCRLQDIARIDPATLGGAQHSR